MTNLKVGDEVGSDICIGMIGKVKEVINNNNFIIRISNKVILCSRKYFTKVNS